MTDFIEFPLESGPQPVPRPGQPLPRRRALRFRVIDGPEQLPEEAGLFVLMGARPGETPRPLAFGHVPGNLRKQLPQRPEFAQALREGYLTTAIAPLPPGCDPERMVEALGRQHRAPINRRQRALREIDAARLRPAPLEDEPPLAAQ
ncbi:hypothetical protein KM176_00345 [Pseudooceanicola sp. CBS1P-1]|uniref:Uncharacterized protein n=1 Tax=Pseudooceanicola albus TaxID=2692189 RepID=A0A6L7G0D1_9RHOB|nr:MULTISPECIES: hypothetical protein [Pseudooceanicola]MBT9382295.1 hypothetical protein [Pseudooceanicola endophyticus]MXN16837.1 hypothetical protein [Pseudooceanicola albus]